MTKDIYVMRLNSGEHLAGRWNGKVHDGLTEKKVLTIQKPFQLLPMENGSIQFVPFVPFSADDYVLIYTDTLFQEPGFLHPSLEAKYKEITSTIILPNKDIQKSSNIIV